MAKAPDPVVAGRPERAHWLSYARQFRAAIELATRELDFLEVLKRVGKAAGGEAGGLPANKEVEQVLMRVSRAVQAERRARSKARE